MIKNIVFDMGNVLIHFNRDMFMDRLGITGEDRVLLTNEVFRSLEWAGLDRGTHTEREAADKLCRRLPERLHDVIHSLVEDCFDPIIPMTGMADIVRRLKENGYSLYLLSNAGYSQHDYWPNIPGNEYFDGKVISADYHYIKPQPELYIVLLEKYGLVPSECLFIDDNISNAEGATQCGMEAVVFHGSAEGLIQKLREAGINI